MVLVPGVSAIGGGVSMVGVAISFVAGGGGKAGTGGADSIASCARAGIGSKILIEKFDSRNSSVTLGCPEFVPKYFWPVNCFHLSD